MVEFFGWLDYYFDKMLVFNLSVKWLVFFVECFDVFFEVKIKMF